VPNETFDLAGPAGRLEAVLMRPETEPIATAVVCHAHPRHGGMMHFKVVFRAAKALQEQGLAALRFNFRGVGRSEGTYDEGRGEQDDVRAALDEMERRYPRQPMALGGFSFGSVMALRVGGTDARARALFALGVPLTSLGDTTFLGAGGKPRLFVQGEKDQYGPGERLRELAAGLPPPLSVEVIPDTDHFFTEKLDVLQRTISAWAAGRPWEAPA
jgi:uncharacterized protein